VRILASKTRKKKPRLVLAGKGDGTPPTLDELVKLTEALTGEAPTPEEIEEMRAIYEGEGSGEEGERGEE
jgi:hypothetical protein